MEASHMLSTALAAMASAVVVLWKLDRTARIEENEHLKQLLAAKEERCVKLAGDVRAYEAELSQLRRELSDKE